MKKHLFVICFFAIFASTAQAHMQTNFLLGISGGVSWQNSNDDITVSVLRPDIGFFGSDIISNEQNRARGLWGFLAGYQASCDGWLFGAELNLDWRTNDDDISFMLINRLGTQFAGAFTRDRQPVVGLTARIGLNASPLFIPYIRLGADVSRRTNQFTLTSITLVPAITTTVSEEGTNRWGFVGGLGAEFPLDKIKCGLSLRAEWDYHSRGHNSDNSIVALASDGISLIGVSGINEGHEQTARASLVFNFSG